MSPIQTQSARGNDNATVPIGTLANLPTLITRLGHDGWQLLNQYGLSPESFYRPFQPAPIALCGELIYRASILTGSDDLPMLLGSMAQMENMGPLRMLVASCSDLGEALDALLRFRRLWYSPIRVSMNVENRAATLSVDVLGNFLGHQEIRTTYLTAMAHNIANLSGKDWKLKQIAFTRPRPATLTQYRRVFGVTPKFEQVKDELVFDARLLSLKRKTSSGDELNEWFRGQMVGMEESLSLDFPTQVSDLIEALIMGRGCNVQRVAELLGMSTITLYRKLQLHGITFEKMLDAERERLAKNMLQRKSMPVHEIASALGYSAASNFTRAFSRWTGQSPEQWRRSMENTANS
jgi:AraC-like DNA-binding protein